MAAVDGGGIRHNQGKVPYDVLPLSLMLAWVYNHPDIDHPAWRVLLAMAAWQAGDDSSLNDALNNSIPISARRRQLVDVANAALVFQHVTTREVKPYPKWNWMRGMPWSIPLGCIIRHALAWLDGEENDPETGLPHQGHIQCNLVMLKYYAQHYPQGDDRPKAASPVATA